MAFSDATLLSKIGLGIAIAAVLFDIIGFPTPYWFSSRSGNFGLFKACNSFGCSNLAVTFEWESTARAFNILGFLLGLATLILLVLYVAVKNDMKILQLIGYILAFVAGVFILSGASVFAGKVTTDLGLSSENLSWSFGLTILASLLFLATGAVNLIDKVKG